MENTKSIEPPRNKFFIEWIPVEGEFAKAMGYSGPWAVLPFFILPKPDPDPGEGGKRSLWQLQQGLVYGWDKEPQGPMGLDKKFRRKILESLGKQKGGLNLVQVVVEVNGYILDRVGLDQGLACVINGLEICNSPDYDRIFIYTAITYLPQLGEVMARHALEAIIHAAYFIKSEDVGQAVQEITLAAEAAALAVLGDKDALSVFCDGRLQAFKFTTPALAAFTADISVRPNPPLPETFIHLSTLMREALPTSR
ncbi:MAG: hypothetical protein A2117_01305 [Candidatus Wildermuthbacteria bacterium GWA2_46_15]|uniref:Uncharacterized protein n=1 Tax=Candidatus Wildermuthbacteria bacterium GWA2_46_15 TaxID=1802443 RepID=A0A1G2QQ32_9BACT|nr:MAG: hypothetical protein A2117_01305 [Candidatus Wildermuthbacteria bacterium GWA2_46_15]